MSLKEVSCYTIACDWPGCEATADDDGEFSGWVNRDDARMSAEERDGWRGHGWDDDKDSWFCNRHPGVWSSDHEDDKPYPTPPFLLIHDGDRYDDGHVSLIAHMHDGEPCYPGDSCPAADTEREAQHYDALIGGDQ